MADDEEKIRKRLREREDELDAEIQKNKKASIRDSAPNKELLGEKLDDLLARAEPLVEQLNNLYNIYASGAELNPPIERRKNLEQVMVTLQMMPKPTPGALYKYTAIQGKFQTYRNRWDKLMKDLESGKIRRRVGPGKGR